MGTSRKNGTAMAVCNAANEIAVAAFLDGQIRFTDIPRLIEQTLAGVPVTEADDLTVVEQADDRARVLASEILATMQGSSRIAERS